MIMPLTFNSFLGAVLTVLLFTGQGYAELVVRNAPGKSTGETMHLIRRALDNAEIWKREEEFRGSADFNVSMNNMLLFTFDATDVDNFHSSDRDEDAVVGANIEVWCETCYVKGVVSASLTTNGSLLETVGEAIDVTATEVGEAIENITSYVGDVIQEAAQNIAEGNWDPDSWDLPVLDLDFDIDLPEMPEYVLQIGFDDLEVYAGFQTIIATGVTYEINLWRSGPKALAESLSWDIDGALALDVGLSVDLIISVDEEITISNGFHLKLEDGVQFQIALFSEEISEVILNGGHFEFLPVTIEASGTRYDAVLRLSAFAGINLPGSFLTGVVEVLSGSELGVGVFVSVHANVVEFFGNITMGNDDADDECAFQMDATYQFGIGAAAGAYAFINKQIYAAAAETNIPIWGTRVGEICATSGDVLGLRSTEVSQLDGRQDMSTTTTTTERTYTGTQCLSTGLTECPVPLQTVRKFFRTETLTTAVPSGEDASWDEQPMMTDFSARPFGDSVHVIITSAGTPERFNIDDSSEDGTGGVSNKVIIGVSVGVGVPVLAASVGLIYFFLRRRQRVDSTPPPVRETAHAYAGKEGVYDYTGQEGMPAISR